MYSSTPMPSDRARATYIATTSSKANAATRSPRWAAASEYWAAMADLPQPAGPMSSRLDPRSGPPPRSASSAGTPLETGARW